MNVITILHFSAFLANGLLMIYILSKNPTAFINRLCAFLISLFALWSLAFAFGNMAHSQEEVMFFLNISAIAWCSFPVVCFWFYLALTNQEKILKNKMFILVSVFIPAFFIYEQWTGNIAAQVLMVDWGWFGIWSQSIYTYLYFAYFSGLSGLCIVLIYLTGRKAETYSQRKQARILTVTGGLTFVLGALSNVICPLLGITVIPSAADILLMIWGIGIVYSVSKYGLMTLTPMAASEQILSTMSDLLILLNKSGKIVYSNRSIINLLEMDGDELYGADLGSIFEDKLKAEDLVKETMEHGKVVNREISFLSTKNVPMPVLVSTSLVRDIANAPAGLVISARDIRELNRKTSELENRNEQLAKINQITRQISSSLDLDRILNICVNESIQLFEILYAGIYLWDTEKSSLELVVQNDIPDNSKCSEYHINQISAFAEPFYSADKSILFGNLKELKHGPQIVNLAFAKDNGLSFGLVAVNEGNNKLGLLAIITESQKKLIRDEQLLLSFVSQVAAAIEKSKLHADVVHRMLETETSRNNLKDAMDALAKSEELLKRTIGAVTDGIVVTDLKGIITDVNEATLKILGYSDKDEIIGQSLFDFVCGMEYEKALNVFHSSVSNGISGKLLEYKLIKKGGTEFDAEINAAEIADALGIKTGIVVSVRDVTERKRVYAKLRSQKELIDRILKAIPPAVLVIGKDSRIVLANHAFYSNQRKNPFEVEGKLLADVMSEDNLLKWVSKSLAGSSEDSQLEFRHGTNGNSRVFVANILPMQKEEVLLVLNDVTEERERQERLYLTDRLASVGEMASGIAHELNNPLTSVIGLSQLMLGDNVPEELKVDLEAIYSEALRASTVVKNLLTFARRHTPVRQKVQVHKIIDDILKLRAYEHKVNNINVRTEYEDDLPEITVDYFQMQQVFLNVILNAESAMIEAHNRGSLIIKSWHKDNHVVVSFTDDGTGIARENLKHIFDPFFTTKEVGKGTGLGLSICYGIVTNHDGKIYADSIQGKSTTFYIELPVQSAHAVSSTHAERILNAI
jgi:PAS domain S-box-containing protein